MTIPKIYDDKNIIAMIIRGEIPNHTVYEDDRVLAFMDIMPQSEGHLLVVTKAHAVSLLDVEPDDLTYLMKKVQTIAQKMESYFKADGILLRQFNGEAAGQTIFHLHFHLIPVKQATKLKGHGLEMADADILAKQAADLKLLLA
ncbi:MAG: HIT domain-containing protein [OCS116 cluster bacterium]|uniref:HIT family protein n=1 Tax=OCS116 cluster bacterium TaxID=2030921 RepID=A0A2A4YV84_9PROT|nr:HIT domain-containing protein [OCS116 cluster bacterium]